MTTARDLTATVREALALDEVSLTDKEYEDALDALAALEKQAEDAQAYERISDDLERECERLEARAVRAEEALRQACDVAIWLSALVPHEGEAWDTWERMMRPRLFDALAAAGADTEQGE